VALAAVTSSLLVASAFAQNPVPQIVGPVHPDAVAPGGGDFTLSVYGANFVPGAVVNWNYQPRTTTYVSGHELQAQILSADIAKNTAGYITVTNPAPGGGSPFYRRQGYLHDSSCPDWRDHWFRRSDDPRRYADQQQEFQNNWRHRECGKNKSWTTGLSLDEEDKLRVAGLASPPLVTVLVLVFVEAPMKEGQSRSPQLPPRASSGIL
jgi:hypothetical protein